MLDSVLRGGRTLEAASGGTRGLPANDQAFAIAIAGEVLRRLPDLDTLIETNAVIRNLQRGANGVGATGEPAVHGLEFDRLDAAQQMAMKVFVFDRQDDVLYWTNGTK